MKRSLFLAAAGMVASTLVMAQQEPPRNPNPQNPTQQPGRPPQPQPDRSEQPNVQRPENKTPADSDKERKSEPVAEHRNLDQFVGNWEVTGTCSAEDSATPKRVTGTLTAEWVLGRHFIRSQMKATEGGKSIEGIGFCGYDPQKGKYVSSWHTDQCNSIKLDEGTYEQGQKVFTYNDEMTGPDGKNVKCRRVVKVVSNDEHTMTIYSTEAGKAEQKMTELTFKRSSRTARADGSAQP